jgi:DNA-binding CsgD family transcriptional regulator
MANKNVDALSEGQRACLRLVLAGYEAKEIAIELQVPPTTVIERLRSARETLGVSRSKDAARILAQHEGVEDNNWFVPKAHVVAATPGGQPNIASPDDQAMGRSEYDPVEVHEAQAEYMPLGFSPQRTAIGLAPPGGSAQKGFGQSAGLGTVIAVAVGIGTAICLALLAALILTKLLQTH